MSRGFIRWPITKKPGSELLEELEIANKRDALPGELSRGMKQKLAIACGLLHSPKVIFFDEPLTGLDPIGIRRMKDSILKRAHDGAAIIISSHLLHLVEEICSRILILKDGLKSLTARSPKSTRKFSEQPGDDSLEEIFFRATSDTGPTPPAVPPPLPLETNDDRRAVLSAISLGPQPAGHPVQAASSSRNIWSAPSWADFIFTFISSATFSLGSVGQPAANLVVSPEHRQLFELGGALLLFIIVLLAWLIPHERAALTFTEAEVAFLFPAPVSRRTLIHFKLLRSQLRILFSALLLTLVSRRFGGNVWIHAFGWWLMLSTLNLHLLGSSFARTLLLDQGISNRLRRLLVFGLALAVAGAVWVWAKRTLPALGPADTANLNAILDYARRVLTAGPALYLLYPFRLVVRPFFAPDAAAFFAALPPVLLIFLLHYLWVIYSDVAFEEASVEASQKLAARVAAVRAGNWRGVKKNQKARRPWFRLAATGPRRHGVVLEKSHRRRPGLFRSPLDYHCRRHGHFWLRVCRPGAKPWDFPGGGILPCLCPGLFAVAGAAIVAAGFSE